MHRRFQSLQFRLALRLAILFIGATALVFVILAYRAYETAGSLNDRELSLRAEDLAGSVRLDDARNPLVELPPSLTRAYSGGAALYVIRAPGGGVIAASSASVADRVRGWPSPGEDPSYFRLTGLEEGKDYYGLNISLESAAGPLWVTVAQAGEANTLVQSLLWEFGTDLTWLIPLFTLVTLAIGVIAIRGGLKPVKAVAAMAAAIGPEATSIRLPEKNLPTEIAPLGPRHQSRVGPARRRFLGTASVYRQRCTRIAHATCDHDRRIGFDARNRRTRQSQTRCRTHESAGRATVASGAARRDFA